MKKMFFALMMMLTATVSANAMSYEQAREEALFLTDKMAYELNLTDEQYEAAYEINLDYLMGVTSRYDVYGTYWERRNLDLSYILLDWQWNAFIAASYFYRPLYWDAGYWHFGIYARYPHRDYFYFGRPHFYHSYRGAHAWHRVGGHGYYHGHREHFHAPHREHIGMHDRWNRGDFRGSHRHSSTRVTAGDRGRIGRGTIERNPGRDRGIERRGSYERRGNIDRRGSYERRDPSRSIDGRNSHTPQRSIERGSRDNGTFNGSSNRSGMSSHRSSTFSGSSSNHRGFSGGSHSSGSHSGGFSGGSHSHSGFSGGSHSGGSHSGGFSGGSRGGGSFSGGSHGGGSHGGGHSGGGGGRMGGRR
jgi:hypothetical protein